jgi:hypothetical protein
MPGKTYHPDVLEQARAISEAWKQINPSLAIGELTQAALSADLDQVTPIAAQIVALETQLTDLRNQRDALYVGLWDKVKRARNGFKAIYGDDSSQYEMAGGTRVSDRKARTRKAAPSRLMFKARALILIKVESAGIDLWHLI